MVEGRGAAASAGEGTYKALGEDGNPSFEMIRSIRGAMGLRLTVESAEAA